MGAGVNEGEGEGRRLRSPICISCAEKARMAPVCRYAVWVDECANCGVSRQVTHLDDWAERVDVRGKIIRDR
jgi:hypothetical protein